ncbi:type IX secretion system protein PorQ [Fulvitalea axinellae]
MIYPSKFKNVFIQNLRVGILIPLVTVFLFSGKAQAQYGGRNSFPFLDLPAGAEALALGGVGLTGKSAQSFWNNPASLDKDADNVASFGYAWYPANMGLSRASYSRDFEKTGMWAIGIAYLGHGDIDAYDDTGNKTGTFNASDYVITLGKSHQMGPFRMGLNLKYAESRIDSYKASAILLDIGGRFEHPKKDLAVDLVVTNIGAEVSRFEDQALDLPLDVRLGASFKPEHMPVRFHLAVFGLGSSGEIYSDPDNPNKEEGDEPSGADKVLTHMSLGGEIIFSPKFVARLGYNGAYQYELQQEGAGGLSGFSGGFGLKLKRFRFDYAMGGKHASGAAHQISLSVNLSKTEISL